MRTNSFRSFAPASARPFTWACVLVAAFLSLGAKQSLAKGQSRGAAYATAQASAFTPHLRAYAQVVPIAVLPVRAAEQGILDGLSALPGMRVRAGEELAHLEGPQITSMLLQDRANVRSARAQLTAAQRSFVILKQQLISHLSTRQAVHAAESAVAQSQTNFDNARSRLAAVRRMMTVRAPASGIVLSVNASSGELVATGAPVVTLQLSGRLWLRAVYYGADLRVIQTGVTGEFSPAGGSDPIPVRVAEILGALTAGGGESVALVPRTRRFNWMNGEYGTVRLDLPARRMVAVPTRALIIDRGKWWVLVHTPQGDRPQAVVPGPARGWMTYLKSGLEPGAQVVVENAYLLFHRGIARRYQPAG